MAFGYQIFFVERAKFRVVRWNPDSGATSIVTGGTGSINPALSVTDPYDLAFNQAGELLVTDKHLNRICRFGRDGMRPLSLSDPNGHRARQADSPSAFVPEELLSPASLFVEKSGALLCAFYDDHTVYRIHSNGRLELVAGLAPNRPYFHDKPRQYVPPNELKSEPILCPTGVVAKRDGTVYFIERMTQTVREIHPERGMRSVFALAKVAEGFRRTSAPPRGRLDDYHPAFPTCLALDGREALFLCDPVHSAVLRLDLEEGTFERVLFTPRGSGSRLDGGPVALAFGRDGTAWVANSNTNTIKAYGVNPVGEWSPKGATLSQVQGDALNLTRGGMGLVVGD